MLLRLCLAVVAPEPEWEKLARPLRLEGGRRVARALSERPEGVVVVGTGREDLRFEEDSAREKAAEGGRACVMAGSETMRGEKGVRRPEGTVEGAVEFRGM